MHNIKTNTYLIPMLL